MVVNDPIADMLTRIRNAQIARHDSVVIPASNIKRPLPRSFWTRVTSSRLKTSRTACRAASRSG